MTINPRLFTFVGGNAGSWAVTSFTAIAGESLPVVERLEIVHGMVADLAEGAKWALRGVTSNSRYTTREEKARMVAKQADLGRPEATLSALIPIRKSPEWWGLGQDERRAIFEEHSKHIAVGLKYLPAVARRLHHCRDLSETEPFDFITYFDYSKADENAFNEMLATMRDSEEWRFVDREIDIRLERI
jgi:chlorite dismutase